MGIRTLDLFCGGGGSSYGARNAGAQIVCGVDACPIAVETYKTNFPDAKAIRFEMRGDSGPELLGDIGKIDLLLASPECTNHTCARGSRPRIEESRDTARYVLNFARELEPRWIVIENVIHMKSWDGYGPLLSELRALGYHPTPRVLDSSDFGVRQTRKRLFILCDRQANPFTIKTRPGRRPAAAGILDNKGTWQSRPLYSEGRAAATIERAERAMNELGMYTPFLIVYYGSDGPGGWQALDRPLRTITTLDRFGLVTWDGCEPMLRMLQPSELARAMGFQADYRLDHVRQRRDRIRLLGNGVAPPVMEAIVQALTISRGDVIAFPPGRPLLPTVRPRLLSVA